MHCDIEDMGRGPVTVGDILDCIEAHSKKVMLAFICGTLAAVAIFAIIDHKRHRQLVDTLTAQQDTKWKAAWEQHDADNLTYWSHREERHRLDMVDQTTEWHRSLIAAGFAEYNRKTGEWQLRSADDIAGDPALIKPLPPATPTPDPVAEHRRRK